MTDKLTQARFTREAMGPEQHEQRMGDDRRELSPHQEYLEQRLRGFFAKCLAIFVVLGMTNAVALLGFGIVLGKQSDLTRQIQHQTRQIQRQRYDSFFQNCVETDDRNANVNKQIDAAIAKLPPRGHARAAEKAKPFRLILNAAVPLRSNCSKYAEDRVRGER